MSQEKKALELAGILAHNVRVLVGGKEFTSGWYMTPANLDNVSSVVKEVRKALDDYDQFIMKMK